MSNLLTAMSILMKTFDKYASEQGSANTLNKAEVKHLLSVELPGFDKAMECQDTVTKLVSDLDMNKDQEIDFTEFMVLVTALCCILKE